jgi:ADA HAT complex component 1
MQSMFRLPWSSEAPGDKIMEKAALHKSRPVPVVEIPNFMSKLKRKRTDSPEPASTQQAQMLKKWKGANGEVKPAVVDRGQVIDAVVEKPVKPAEAQSQETPKIASAEVLQSRPKAQPSRKESTSQSKAIKTQKPTANPDSSAANDPTLTMETNLNEVQQQIEHQFNLEILLKHNELRLIEQELAKCQVALEQLRRCSLIPYPGTEGLSQDVSNGVGPSLQPPAGYTEPQFAAPWGVTDGPYTRHYAKWLIPDPQFDPMPERALAQQSQGYFGVGEGRTTRGSFAEFGATGKARTSRTSTGTLRLQALGENPPPAPKIDPLLHKRSTDGQWVRLYCAQCGHSNFSNTQGFLNHCRIKHNQVFKSHDQAAIACGIPVDVNEAGNPVLATEPSSATTATPMAASFPVPATPGSVHPLIRSNLPDAGRTVFRDYSERPLETPRSDASAPKPEFVKSTATPYLNSVLETRGFEGNFKDLVDTARTRVDLSSMDTSDNDTGDSGAQTPMSSVSAQQLVRVPGDAATARPPTKGHSTGPARFSHLPSPVSVGFSRSGNGHTMPFSPVELSPNTVDSNPGLVSDHDDDEDEDGYDARSQTDIAMEDDVLVEDGSDVEGVHDRNGSRNRLEGCFQKGEGSRKH